MLVARRSTLLGLAAVTALVAFTAGGARLPEPERTHEVARLRAHFDSVLADLRSADVSRLNRSQRDARQVLIGRLAAYSAAGRFPHNHAVPGARVPVFRDEHGTMCAMGYLIASTGRTDIVNDVARANNLAYIPQLTSDPRLVAWLDSTGLTVAEASRVQPAYDGGGCCTIGPSPTSADRHATQPGYYVGSAVAASLSGFAMALNTMARFTAAPSRNHAAIGFVSGAAQLVLGAFVVDRGGTAGTVGVANMLMGAATAGTAAWRLEHPARPSVASRNASIHPFVTPRGEVGVGFAARM